MPIRENRVQGGELSALSGRPEADDAEGKTSLGIKRFRKIQEGISDIHRK